MGCTPALFGKYYDGIWHILQYKYPLAQGTIASGHIGMLQHGIQNLGQHTIFIENMTESTYFIDKAQEHLIEYCKYPILFFSFINENTWD